jgi:hypothetical protein
MQVFRKLLMIAAVLTSFATYSCWAGLSQPNNPSLTSEQQEVYGDFIKSFSKMGFKYLSYRTFPLQLSSVGKDSPCLQGIQLDGAAESSNPVHLLNQELLRGQPIHLVSEQEELSLLKQRDAKPETADTNGAKDPGILALSEIAFDKSHRFAVLKYVFLCGSHCNSGAILVMEKVGSQWTGTTRRPCSFVLNNENPRQ